MNDKPATILYVDCTPESGMGRVRLAGIRRYAAAHGWRVEQLEHENCSPFGRTASSASGTSAEPPSR